MVFEEIYAHYKDDVYRFLLKLYNYNQHLADDATQETFMKAYLKLATYQGKSSVKTWLFAIAKNIFLESLRKNKQVLLPVDEFAFLPDQKELPTSQVEKQLLLEESLNCALTLPEKMQAVFFARVFNEEPYTKIAQDCGISQSSAKVLFFRAKKQIKEKLKDVYHES